MIYIFKFVKSRAKNHCNRKIALLSILIQLNSFVAKKSFLAPNPKILITAVIMKDNKHVFSIDNVFG